MKLIAMIMGISRHIFDRAGPKWCAERQGRNDGRSGGEFG